MFHLKYFYFSKIFFPQTKEGVYQRENLCCNRLKEKRKPSLRHIFKGRKEEKKDVVRSLKRDQYMEE